MHIQGGELPDRSQRVIAFGAAANTVHPSTGKLSTIFSLET